MKEQILSVLVEGNSLRSVFRITEVSINTVTKLLVYVGGAYAKFHDENVANVNCRRIEGDEM